MANINYLNGDVTKPIHKNTTICHIVNDIGKMGSGVAKALYEKWPPVKSAYLNWQKTNYRSNRITDFCNFELGNTQFVEVNSRNNIWIANMIAQHSIISMGESKPIRYDALDKCLKEVNEFCFDAEMVLSMPKIGTDRSRGDWEIIKDIIRKNMLVETFVYIL